MVNIHAPFGVPGYGAAIALCGGPGGHNGLRSGSAFASAASRRLSDSSDIAQRGTMESPNDTRSHTYAVQAPGFRR